MKKVYRLEERDNGEGVYIYNPARRLMGSIFFQDDKHPEPDRDSALVATLGGPGRYYGCRFGFCSVEQYRAWFFHNPTLHELFTGANIILAIYEVPDEAVFVGHTQTCFRQEYHTPEFRVAKLHPATLKPAPLPDPAIEQERAFWEERNESFEVWDLYNDWYYWHHPWPEELLREAGNYLISTDDTFQEPAFESPDGFFINTLCQQTTKHQPRSRVDSTGCHSPQQSFLRLRPPFWRPAHTIEAKPRRCVIVLRLKQWSTMLLISIRRLVCSPGKRSPRSKQHSPRAPPRRRECSPACRLIKCPPGAPRRMPLYSARRRAPTRSSLMSL